MNITKILKDLKDVFILNNSDIPSLTFKDNNILHQVSEFYASINTVDNKLSEKDNIALIFDNVAEKIKAPENLEYLNGINNLALSLADEISNCHSTLSGIVRSIVLDVTENVNKRFNLTLKREGDENLIKGEGINTDSLVIMKWDELSSRNINNIIAETKRICNFNSDIVNKNTVDAATIKLIQPNFRNIKIDKSYDEHKTKVSDYFSTNYKDINTDDALRYFEIITNKQAYFDFCSLYRDDLKTTKTAIDSLSRIMFDCNNLDDFTAAIKKFVNLEFNDVSKNIMYDNIQCVNDSCKILLYNCIYYKNIICKNKLILNKNIVNNEEFSKFKKQGMELKEIATYLKVFHKATTVPTLGISTDLVVAAQENMNKKLEVINESMLLEKNIIFTRILRNSFDNTIMKQFDDIRKTLGIEENNTIKNEYNRVSNVLSTSLKGDLDKIENTVFELIIQSFYKNTITEKLYNYLSDNYTSLLETKQEINNNDITKYDMKSIVTLLTDFLSDQMV